MKPRRILSNTFGRRFYSSGTKKLSITHFDDTGKPLPFVKEIFDQVGQKLQIKTLDGWYMATTEMFDEHAGRTLLRKHFGGSLSEALRQIYPEHQWNAFKFKNKPKGIFQSAEMRREYFEWLGQELGIRQLEDWYDHIPTAQQLRYMGAASLIKRFAGSPILALQSAYPEHVFHPWKFSRVPEKYWKNPKTLRLFFENLGKRLGIESLSDWYSVADRKLLGDEGGWSALFKHKNISSILALAYPEHEFLEWRFANVPSGFWQQQANRRRVLIWIAQQKGLISQASNEGEVAPSDLEQLYQIQVADLSAYGVVRLMSGHSDMAQLLSNTFPEFNWNGHKFSHLRDKT